MSTQNQTIITLNNTSLLFNPSENRFELSGWGDVDSDVYEIARYQACDDVSNWEDYSHENITLSLKALQNLPEFSQTYTGAYEGLSGDELTATWLASYCFALNNLKHD